MQLHEKSANSILLEHWLTKRCKQIATTCRQSKTNNIWTKSFMSCEDHEMEITASLFQKHQHQYIEEALEQKNYALACFQKSFQYARAQNELESICDSARHFWDIGSHYFTFQRVQNVSVDVIYDVVMSKGQEAGAAVLLLYKLVFFGRINKQPEPTIRGTIFLHKLKFLVGIEKIGSSLYLVIYSTYLFAFNYISKTGRAGWKRDKKLHANDSHFSGPKSIKNYDFPHFVFGNKKHSPLFYYTSITSLVREKEVVKSMSMNHWCSHQFLHLNTYRSGS